MPKINVYHHALNVGVVDQPALARVDLERMRLAAEKQTNLLGTTAGRAFLRPGLEYSGSTYLDRAGRLKSFIRGSSSAALLEFTTQNCRVWVDDALVTRPAVTSTITSGDFSAATGWTLASTAGQTTSVSGGFLELTATARGGLALAKQQVSTSSAGTLHALRIVIDRGPVTFRCGSTDGGDEYISETQLAEGTHSLAFTPAGSYWVQFQTDSEITKKVDAIEVEGSGVMTLPTPWTNQKVLRFSQSIDVMFVADGSNQQRRIERRGDNSWSVVKYFANDGPFTLARTAPVRLKPAATYGNTTLTADKPFFTASHVGALFRLFHEGQNTNSVLAGDVRYSDPIKVTGVKVGNHSDRLFNVSLSGTYAGTVSLYRSFDGEDFGYQNYSNPPAGTTQINDDNDNAIIWYRVGFGPGWYTSGTATVGLAYGGGGGHGIARVTGYTSSTQVDIEVLTPFLNTSYTADWREGEWSDARGWPSAVALAEGRLWWGGNDKFWGSVSDAYDSFDEDVEGDSGPVLRNIATDGINAVQSFLPLQRLVALTDGSEAAIRSSSFDEPLSPTNATVKTISTYGSDDADSVKIDSRGLFVGRSGTGLFEVLFDIQAGDLQTSEVTKLNLALFSSGIKEIAVQRRPDTRAWVVNDDGSLVCIVYEPQQEVIAFIPVETDGTVESVAVLPGTDQDRPYFIVNRTINGSTVRYIEKMAKDSEAVPGTIAKVMDAFKSGTQASSTTISGLSHLEGEQVKVWADGAPITEEVTPTSYLSSHTTAKLFTVSGGSITLDDPVENYCVGLPYKGRYKSAKLAYGAGGGTAMLQEKRVDKLGMVLADFVRSGIRYGTEFDNDAHPLYPLPEMKEGVTATDVVTGTPSDEKPFVFPGKWDVDSRVCIEAIWPVSILGLVMSVTTNG